MCENIWRKCEGNILHGNISIYVFTYDNGDRGFLHLWPCTCYIKVKVIVVANRRHFVISSLAPDNTIYLQILPFVSHGNKLNGNIHYLLIMI